MYEVIVAPPLDAGAVNETLAVVAPVAAAVTDVGAPATVTPPDVVMELDVLERVVPEKPKPYSQEIVTLNVYEVPGVKPETLIVPVREADNSVRVILA